MPTEKPDRNLRKGEAYLVGIIIVSLIILFWVFPIAYQSKEIKLRDKVDLVYSGMWHVACALESYNVDNGIFPPALTPFLTSPANYIEKLEVDIETLPSDPLAHPKGNTFRYDASKKDGWILWSCGPDGIYDIDPKKGYDPHRTNSMDSLLRKTYDTSNGSVSRGDIWRIQGQ